MSDNSVSARLRRRAAEAGPDPLLTYYEPAVGTRIELSATTLLNWVDKTSHLLDELDVTAGDRVALVLAETAPGHWVTVVWELACWQVGAAVIVGPVLVRQGAATDARLLVTGPDWVPYADAGPDVVACSLHPLGLPLGGRLASSVLDYALEVRGQADRYAPSAQPAVALAWQDPERRLSQADLVSGSWPTGRQLVRPSTAWPTARAAALGPVLGGGSAVVVAGLVADDQLARIADQERTAR
ncbi:TIGR03089 family protein [uncultured Friedmanniella sp.]|uniref:TIGR03089 family protein n=1 Tax=uncultured Friedmanniella sp. TaxID=335381 RepID=UPI0035CB5217